VTGNTTTSTGAIDASVFKAGLLQTLTDQQAACGTDLGCQKNVLDNLLAVATVGASKDATIATTLADVTKALTDLSPVSP
jgi:hypothetical protein